MMDFYNQKHAKARKSHKCEFCGKEIIPGETYSYESGKFDGHGYYDGYKWMDKYHDTIKNVVAWRIHEPYHPERSDNHDGE